MAQMLFRTVVISSGGWKNGMMRAVHGDSEEGEKSPAPLRRVPFGRAISPLPFAAVEMTVRRGHRCDWGKSQIPSLTSPWIHLV